MGKHFGMSASGTHYWLKKFGYKYKKKASPMWKPANPKEANIKKV